MIKQALAITMLAAGALFAGAANAQTQAYAPRTSSTSGPTWNYNTGAGYRTDEIGNTYTNVLNDLYSHGFHGVHHLRMQNGMVEATAISPHNVQRTVKVNSGSGQISTG